MAKRAKKLKDLDTTGQPPQEGDQDVTRSHNVKDRRATIMSSMKRLYAIDQEIAAIVEDEIKDLREERSDIKKMLRETFQITSAVVNARYHSYRLEQKAIEGDDGPTQDAIREMFEALPVGGQGSLLPGMEAAGPFESDIVPSDEEARGLGYDHGVKDRKHQPPKTVKSRPALLAAYDEGYELGKQARGAPQDQQAEAAQVH